MSFSDHLKSTADQLGTLQGTDVELVHSDQRLQDSTQTFMLICASVSFRNLGRPQPVLVKGGGGQVLISHALDQIE